MHDIGKIGISDRLLQFREKYTKAEMGGNEEHVRIGGMLLKSLGFAEEIVMGALIMEESKGQFDPVVFGMFRSMWEAGTMRAGRLKQSKEFCI